MNRRAIMRGAAALPAAIMGLAKATREIAGGLPVAMPSDGLVAQANPSVAVGSTDSAMTKLARAALKEIDRKRHRTSTGNIAGIDMDLWSLRSVSWQHRARMQADRNDAHRSESERLGKIIWGEEF